MSLRPLLQRVLFMLMFVASVSWSATTQAAPTTERALARFDPHLDALLLEHGYTRNIIGVGGLQVLRASQRNYTDATWSRDLDYALTGYSYTLHDMTVLRDNLQLFLDATDAQGVVPEFYDIAKLRGTNREAWDSMPNVVHASYVYIAKTGDRDWASRNIETLERIVRWIERLDTNGDALPDRDIFPYGYNDATQNGVMHTFALAKFYAAYRELAALERFSGRDGSRYEVLASKLRANFHASSGAKGYWPTNQTWPIAWRKADGRVFPLLETFGIFQAVQDGLIGPPDGWRYRNLMTTMHEQNQYIIAGPTPTKFTVGGYPLSIRRDMVPAQFNWVLDSASPWIVGLQAPVVAQAGYDEDAAAVLDAYERMALTTDPPVMEGAAGPDARYGPGDSQDRGRTWDNAAWFSAVYGGHYGLRMTPTELIVAPRPIRVIAGDRVDNVLYQGARLSLELDVANRAYRLSTDRAVTVRLQPMGDGATITVDGIERGPELVMNLVPLQAVYVQTGGYTTQRADSAFEQVWRRADAPIQRGEASRSWLWGPAPFRTTVEPYAESPNGERLVDYYDKARMEITRPGADRRDRYFVTNGLLVKELVSGQLQLGDAQFATRLASDLPVAGDPTLTNPAPRYAAWEPHTSLDSNRRAPSRLGADVTATINRNGELGDEPNLKRKETQIAQYDATLGHNIPQVIWQFLQAQGEDWLFAFGYPISEPYWTRAQVGGVEKWVLVQMFERRTVTYTPGNPRGFEVEMGNVGQHYHQWRYGFRPWDQWQRPY